MPPDQSFFSVLRFEGRGQARNIGVLLYDAGSRILRTRFLSDYSFLIDEEEIEIVAGVGEELARQALEYSDPILLVEHLEDTLSNTIQISERFRVETASEETLKRVFEIEVESTT